MSEGWREQVLEEKRELKAKLDRLAAFVHMDEYSLLQSTDQSLLQAQRGAMIAYWHILDMRVKGDE